MSRSAIWAYFIGFGWLVASCFQDGLALPLFNVVGTCWIVVGALWEREP